MTRLRVVIVEDDPQVAIVTRGFVERHGGWAVVGVAGTGASALELIETLVPDVVLLDVHLPDGSGLAVLRRARAQGSRAEVIAVTASRDLETVRLARAYGVRHYLVKPFAMRSLHERLDDVRATLERGMSVPRASLDQDAVDAIMGAPAVASARRPASERTLERVAEALAAADGDVSAAELGASLGLSRVSARRYLERLVELDAATVTPRYGRSGRPEHRYAAWA